MPKVPQLQPGAVRTRALPGVRFTTQVPGDAFRGGLTGRGVTQAATGLIQTVGRVVEEEQLKADKSNVRNISLEAVAEKNRLLKGEVDEDGNVVTDGYLQQKGKNAFEKKQEFLDKWNDIKKLAETRVTNDRQKELLNAEITRIDLEYNNSIQNHEFNEYDAVTVQSFRDGANNVIEDVRLNFIEPNKVQEGLKTLDDIANDLADYQGLAPESRERLVKEYRSNAHTSLIIDRLNENDDEVAKNYFTQNKNDMTVDDAKKVKSLFGRKQQRLTKIRKQNPWSYFQEVGDLSVAKGFKPVNFNQATTIEDRLKFVTEAGKKHGFSQDQVTFLTPDEENNIVNFLNKSNPAQSTQFIRSIGLNSSPEVMSRVSEQLFRKDPGIGIAMAVSVDDFGTANKIVAGRKILIGDRQKSTATGAKPILQPSSKDVSEKFDSIIGNSIADPNLRIRMREAVYYHYVKGQFDANEDLQIWDESNFDESFQAVMGEMAEVNDVKVFSFRDDKGIFVEPDELEDSFDDLNDDVVQETHGDVPRTINGQPVDLEKTSGRITPISSADGKYVLKRDGELLLDSKGKPFEVDMRKIVNWNRKNKKGLVETTLDFFK